MYNFFSNETTDFSITIPKQTINPYLLLIFLTTALWLESTKNVLYRYSIPLVVFSSNAPPYHLLIHVVTGGILAIDPESRNFVYYRHFHLFLPTFKHIFLDIGEEHCVSFVSSRSSCLLGFSFGGTSFCHCRTKKE